MNSLTTITAVNAVETHQSIWTLLQSHARTREQNPVLKSTRQTALTYQGAFDYVQEIICYLKVAGIQRNDSVALVLPNGPEAAFAFLAVCCIATCAPLNPNYQAPEYEFYLSDLGAKALIILSDMESPARQVAASMNIPVIDLVPHETLAGAFNLRSPVVTASFSVEQPVEFCPEDLAQPDDVALILHTSGTTSRPKMVPLTHHNLISSARNIAETLQLRSQDTCLNVMPLFHIHGLMAALLATVIAGGSIVCTPGFDAAQFFQWVEKFNPSWYTAVPTIHQAVLVAAVDQQAVIKQYPFRFIRSSSSALLPSVMVELEQILNAPVIEAYGMTEASHQMTSNPLPPAARKPRSVGRMGKTKVEIADIVDNVLLPQGAIGEVVIQGKSVTQGYRSNPEANQKAFFDSWFRTGDQGYLDEEGYLFLQGRLKELVNRGGEKIVPLEIDEALMALPEVHQAVAFAVPHPSLGEDLAAAVVLKPNAQKTPQVLRTYLFSQLADFKVPSQILIVDKIPTGATGKLQRISLAKQLEESLKRNYIAPRNDTESEIVAMFQDVLGRDSIGIYENFFMLGGDSLKGMQVTARLNAHFGLGLPYTVVFRHPTVAELTETVQHMTTDDDIVDDLVTQLEHLPLSEVESLLAESEI